MGFVGEIRLFAGSFAPSGWALCTGGSLAISEYDRLFDMIGTKYGGDGETYFNLPNLSGSVPIHTSAAFPLAQNGSAPFGLTNPTTLNYIIATTEFPSDAAWVGEVRTFAFGVTPRDWASCDGQRLAISGNTPLFAILGTTYGGNNTTFGLPNLQGTGAVAPPFTDDATQAAGIGWLTMNYCIALYGIFPQRPSSQTGAATEAHDRCVAPSAADATALRPTSPRD
jgi:microcystin-dependent protein